MAAKNRRFPTFNEVSKPGLVIVASPRARSDPTSSLLRLVRDHAAVLRKYEIHATAETADSILGTGIYNKDEVKKHRSGADGGIAQLAAMVARRQVVAAILLLDPSDPWSDAVENRALARVCIQRQVRLMTTYAAALRWATYEAEPRATTQKTPSCVTWKPSNWKDGVKNVTDDGQLKQLLIQERSIALISHDKKKLEMVELLNENDHLELLAQHHRILATGTTGWLLKLVFCSDPTAYQQDIETLQLEGRLIEVMAELFEKKGLLVQRHEGFIKLLQKLRKALRTKTNDNFSKKIMPLPSGPDGGDVLAADEVLSNQCHAIVFLHDPTSAHPHNDDIRLLDRTSRLPGVFAECVSDRHSAVRWIDGVRNERTSGAPDIAERLREKCRLKEVILVDVGDNVDSERLGSALARACAGFLNQWLHVASHERKDVRIGVAWGWGMKCVLDQLEAMECEGVLKKPTELSEILIWSPIIGIITAAMTDREASTIAGGFRTFYGGRLERFGCAGFAPVDHKIPEDVAEFVTRLERADLILTSASTWDPGASLARNTGLDQSKLPSFSAAIGTISGIFLDPQGREVKGEYSIVGLGYDGFRRASENGSVVLICGGESRNAVALSTLKAGLVSVVVTTKQTAEWILEILEESQSPGSPAAVGWSRKF